MRCGDSSLGPYTAMHMSIHMSMYISIHMYIYGILRPYSLHEFLYTVWIHTCL